MKELKIRVSAVKNNETGKIHGFEITESKSGTARSVSALDADSLGWMTGNLEPFEGFTREVLFESMLPPVSADEPEETLFNDDGLDKSEPITEYVNPEEDNGQS